MATGNFNKKFYNALVYRPILLHLIIILKLTHLHNRLLSGSNAMHLPPEDKRSTKSFDERIINCTYTILEHLLVIAVCSLIMLKDYLQSLTNADILGQGNLNLVSEKSGNFTFYNLWEPCLYLKPLNEELKQTVKTQMKCSIM